MALKVAKPPAPVIKRVRIGCVSFLNAKPLIYGLGLVDTLHLSLDVPARLLTGLVDKQFDIALLPVIDYQRLPGLRLLTAGGIGCEGPTLTVRIFSRIPIDIISTLACDTDSHTSVVLAQIVLAECYGIRPRIIDYNLHHLAGSLLDQNVAQLLIGDKVVCEEPQGMPHQLDLGQAWKELTGLPFLFAAWMAREGINLGSLPIQLEEAKRAGLRHVDEIVRQFAIPRGWPPDVARTYLTEYLQFDITPRHIQAVRLFHRLARQHGLIDHEPWELAIDSPLPFAKG